MDSKISKRNSLRAHNESSRGGPHEIERVASHECQDIVAGRIQNLDIFGPNHFDRVHAITIRTIESPYRNFVALSDITQRPKKCISMPRNAHISGGSRQGGARNMPNRAP